MNNRLRSHKRQLLVVLLFVLFLLPAGFVSVFCSTFIHEVLGHGLMAVAVGGEFSGFEISLDGSGEANATTNDGAPKYERSLVGLGGILVSIPIGLLVLRLGIWKRLPYFLRIWLILLASDMLITNTAYLFFNGMYTNFHGDVGYYLRTYDQIGLKVVVVIIGGAMLAGALLLTSQALFTTMRGWLRGDAFYTRYSASTILFIVLVSRWFATDLLWYIGVWAMIIMTLFMIGLSAWLHYKQPKIEPVDSTPKRAVAPLIIIYAVAGALMFLTLFLLKDGVTF